MSVEIAKKVIDNLDKNINEREIGTPFFSSPTYKVFPLSKENFKGIKQIDNNRKIAFVDGGNQEALGAPNFSVQINRVYFNIFKAHERCLKGCLSNRVEFYSATHSCFKENEIFYDTSLFPLRNDFQVFLPKEVDLSFNSYDRSVSTGTMRADISRMGSIARRFAEWTYANNVVKDELGKGDVIVLDGSLQTSFTNESKYSSELYKKAQSKGVVVAGLSKTSGLFTSTGLSLLGAVHRLATETSHGSWFYPVAQATSSDHNAFIFVVKLHPKAERVFRFEIYGPQFANMSEQDANELFSQLASNSQDISFPGYPYGLIDADQFARVRDKEVGGYQILLLSQISKQGKWEKFAKDIRAGDAHDFLNMLGG